MSVTTRRSQEERSALMRGRLIDAAFTSLVENGYAATSVGAVQARAGVARGTLLHHFPTRASLMVAVIDDIAEQRLRVLADHPAGVADADPWDRVVELVWRDLQSESFVAALELWVAARTDAELREALLPVQERLFVTIHHAVAMLLGSTDDPRVPTLVQFTIDLLTGSTMAGLLTDQDASRRVVERWRWALGALAAVPEAPWD
jgi:AcrR family transcriptional regulator